MTAYIIVLVLAYLIGSVNFSIIISKKMAGFDVREKGSGNAGTTNMLRSVGKKAAAITLICDILKGVVSMIIAIIIGNIANNVMRYITKSQKGGFITTGVDFGKNGSNHAFCSQEIAYDYSYITVLKSDESDCSKASELYKEDDGLGAKLKQLKMDFLKHVKYLWYIFQVHHQTSSQVMVWMYR